MKGRYQWKLPIIVTSVDMALFFTFLSLFRYTLTSLLELGDNIFLWALVAWSALHLPTAWIADWITGWLFPIPPHGDDNKLPSLIFFAILSCSQTFLIFFLIGKWLDRKQHLKKD